MPHALTKTVYYFEELDAKAKENARDWWRQFIFYNSSDWEHVLEDAQQCAELIGIDIAERESRTLAPKHWPSSPAIYFSGFASQGDGASFEGNYKYKKGAAKAIREYAPTDEALHRIADKLQTIQARHFYRLTSRADCKGARYSHSGCMNVETYYSGDEYRDIGDAEKEVGELMRAFADWIYAQLEREYYYQCEDAQIDEAIRANEYEFLENGKRAI